MSRGHTVTITAETMPTGHIETTVDHDGPSANNTITVGELAQLLAALLGQIDLYISQTETQNPGLDLRRLIGRLVARQAAGNIG